MGRRGRRPRQQRDNTNRPQVAQDQDSQRQNYSLAQKENAQFEKYYKMQQIVPEGEWDAFMATLRSNLPTTFRITGYKTEAQEVLKKIKSEFFNNLATIQLDDGTRIEEPPKCLSWYPDELAWQLNMDRKFIRHCQHLEKLHQFLTMETDSGFISRQEAVSMIPPLLMDIQPQHKILDMCAAPGSKTAQMIEMLHSDESNPIPEGFIVANDVDFKRCYLLVHQLQRLASPCFAVINHDAARIPNIRVDDQEDSKYIVQFDRILADVPCTGDGTMRKNKDVWQKWNPINATNLHGIQKRVLRRGVELLATGGRIVYSTCSLNPMEDEAVVAHVLNECKGAIELIDVTTELPGLKFQPGLSTWKVMTKQEEVFEKLEDVPDRLKTILMPSLFPPDAETAASLHLDRCMRILPHQQNTGGFFVAVMKKVRQVPWQPVRPTLPVSMSTDAPTVATDTPAVATDAPTVATDAPTVADTPAVAIDAPAVTNAAAVNSNTTEDTAQGTGKTSDTVVSAVDSTTADSITDDTPAEDTDNTASMAEDTAEKQSNTADEASNVADTGDTENGAGDMHSSEGETPGSSDGQLKRKAEDSSRGPREKKQKKQAFRGNREDPFIYLAPDDSFWPPIKSYYGIKDEFPMDQLMIRCDDGKRRNIYFTNKAVKDLVKFNEGKLKFVNLGLKVLSRCDSPYSQCDFRLVQDGVPVMSHFVTERVVEIPWEDIIVLLGQENPFMSKFTAQTEAQLSVLDQGGCMFSYTPESREGSPQCNITLCGWKAKVSARSFLPRQGRFHYLCLCGEELRPRRPQSGRQPQEGGNEDSNNGQPAEDHVLEIRPQPSVSHMKTEPDFIKLEVKTEVKEEVKSEEPESKELKGEAT